MQTRFLTTHRGRAVFARGNPQGHKEKLVYTPVLLCYAPHFPVRLCASMVWGGAGTQPGRSHFSKKKIHFQPIFLPQVTHVIVPKQAQNATLLKTVCWKAYVLLVIFQCFFSPSSNAKRVVEPVPCSQMLKFGVLGSFSALL